MKLKDLKLETLPKLIPFVKPWAFLYLTGLIGSGLVGFGFDYAMAMGFKGLTDATIAGNLDKIVRSTVFLLVGMCLLAVLNSFFIYQVYTNAKRIAGDIRRKIFGHIQKLPMSYLESQHSGDFISRLTNDIGVTTALFGDPIHMVVRSLISGVSCGIVIFALNWKMGIVAFAVGIFNIWANTFFLKPFRKIGDAIQKTLSNLNQVLSDTLAGTYVIKIFNAQRRILQKYQQENDSLYTSSLKRVKLQSFLNGLNSFSGFMNFVGLTVIGSIMVINNQLTFGTLMAVTQLTGSFFFMFRRVGEFGTMVQSCLAGTDRLFEILDVPDETVNNSKASEKSMKESTANKCNTINLKGPVLDISNVSFGYSKDAKILDSFSLEVFKDQVVAVVGSSGCGKSTLFKLLLSFYRPDDGEIRLFGKPFHEFRQQELRKLIAYVPQDNYLFSGTIRENISFGKPGAGEVDIIEAAKAAYAHDFIMKLPKDYDTEVGERGAHLSGGERQRVAIARALLKDAPILFLDEATSSLDSESEQQVQKALEVLMKGRTTMVIAHRLSTVEHADRIIVIDNGSICEEGTHEALLSLNKSYAHLYNLQFRDTVRAAG